jgi:hypothetical protein
MLHYLGDTFGKQTMPPFQTQHNPNSYSWLPRLPNNNENPINNNNFQIVVPTNTSFSPSFL